MTLNLETSQCAGCGQTFYLQDVRRIVGSPQYNTFCHNTCCGTSEVCHTCDIYIRKVHKMQNVAFKQLLVVLEQAFNSMNDTELRSLEDACLDVGPLIAAELDKRAQRIQEYSVCINDQNRITMAITPSV